MKHCLRFTASDTLHITFTNAEVCIFKLYVHGIKFMFHYYFANCTPFLAGIHF
jgi:hypothetical protein